MKISYNWLRNYIDLPLPEELEGVLVGLGLEVEGRETHESVKGGLIGITVGKVISCSKHPNADKLSLTTVDIGKSELLSIVCGAPNVASGQKVLVATIGTTLWKGEDYFKIQKSKIRGEVSEGMICAEDELGLGESHAGILVLPEDVPVGLAASEYFKVISDTVFEIGLTPNRIDAASHIGIARDLLAYYGQDGSDIKLKMPDVKDFNVDNSDLNIKIEVIEPEACIRYSGITISGLKIDVSPSWLTNYLLSIGLKPINNVVDVTNFVLHETGQPLHAFDASKIEGNKIVVRRGLESESFITLDGVERKLSTNDLMICNSLESMCIAGVFGGKSSGVTNETTTIFIESANFNPIWVRQTARRHALNTDSSFRFERGADPDITVYALKRAALLIKEIAGGTISSNVIDIYPEKVKKAEVSIKWKSFFGLIGVCIDIEIVKRIMGLLEMEIIHENQDGLTILVPPYRVDVTREADVVEEVLRVYGFNKIPNPGQIRMTMGHFQKPDSKQIVELIAGFLVGSGFNEILSNSLSSSTYYIDNLTYPLSECATILNPLSNDLNVLRQSLLFGMLESAQHKKKKKNADLRLFEFGTCYFSNHKEMEKTGVGNYSENQRLALFISGKACPPYWNQKERDFDYFSMKGYAYNIFSKLGIDVSNFSTLNFNNSLITNGICLSLGSTNILETGQISPIFRKKFDLPENSFFAEFNWSWIIKQIAKNKVSYCELSRFPEVRRDLALVIDRAIEYTTIEKIAYKVEPKLLKNMVFFAVFL